MSRRSSTSLTISRSSQSCWPGGRESAPVVARRVLGDAARAAARPRSRTRALRRRRLDEPRRALVLGGLRPPRRSRGARRAAARGDRGARSSSPVECSATGVRVRMPGDVRPRARTSPPPSSAWSRCPGQFEQRRLARPSYQLEVLDRFGGEEQLARRAAARAAWRGLQSARRRHDELTANAALAESHLTELRALVEDTEGMEPGEEDRLRAERERHRHVAELAAAAAAAAAALASDDGEGATGFVALAERSVAPLERLAPELQRAGDELRDAELRRARVRLRPPRVPGLARSGTRPTRAARGRARSDVAEVRAPLPLCNLRRAAVARRAEASAELAALEGGADPAEVAARRHRRCRGARQSAHARTARRAKRRRTGVRRRRRGRAARRRHGRGRVRL